MQSSVQQPLNKRPTCFSLQMGFSQGVSTWALAGRCEHTCATHASCQSNTCMSTLTVPGGFILQVLCCTNRSLHIFQVRASLHLPGSKCKQDCIQIAVGLWLQFWTEDVSVTDMLPCKSVTCLSWLNSLLSKYSFLVICNKTCYVQKT